MVVVHMIIVVIVVVVLRSASWSIFCFLLCGSCSRRRWRLRDRRAPHCELVKGGLTGPCRLRVSRFAAGPQEFGSLPLSSCALHDTRGKAEDTAASAKTPCALGPVQRELEAWSPPQVYDYKTMLLGHMPED